MKKQYEQTIMKIAEKVSGFQQKVVDLTEECKALNL